jgi:hypothetical protein
MSLTNEEIRELVAKEAKDQLHAAVQESVRQTLIQLGIASNDPIEMQKDMQHLRAWRQSMESVRSKSILTAVGILMTGTLAALWVGFKEIIGK